MHQRSYIKDALKQGTQIALIGIVSVQEMEQIRLKFGIVKAFSISWGFEKWPKFCHGLYGSIKNWGLESVKMKSFVVKKPISYRTRKNLEKLNFTILGT